MGPVEMRSCRQGAFRRSCPCLPIVSEPDLNIGHNPERMPVIVRSLLFGLAAFSLLTAQAQVAVGFRGGITWAKMVETEGVLNETKARRAPAGAIMVELPLSERLGLASELGFIQRGYRQKTPPYAYYPQGELNTVLDYADLAILAKFHLGQEPVRPYLLLGGTVGRMLGARQYLIDEEGKKDQGTVLDPDKLGMAQWNLGLCVGAGFTFTTGTSHVLIEGRYLYGLTNIWNGLVLTDLNGARIGDLNGFDRSIQFTIGWIFPVGKRKNADATKAPPSAQ